MTSRTTNPKWKLYQASAWPSASTSNTVSSRGSRTSSSEGMLHPHFWLDNGKDINISSQTWMRVGLMRQRTSIRTNRSCYLARLGHLWIRIALKKWVLEILVGISTLWLRRSTSWTMCRCAAVHLLKIKDSRNWRFPRTANVTVSMQHTASAPQPIRATWLCSRRDQQS